MSRYMTQFSYTREAWQTLVSNPQDRKKTVAGLIKKMGGRLLDLYYTMGDYDGFIIFEAPDDESAAGGVLAAMATGHLSAVKTTKIFTMKETIAAMERAGEVTYKAPKED